MKTTEKNKKNKMNTTERYEFNKEKWFDSVGDFNVNTPTTHNFMKKYLREGLHVQPDMMVDCINIVEDLMIEEFGKLFNYEINIVTDSVLVRDIIDRVDPSRKNYNEYWNKVEFEDISVMRPYSTNIMIGINVTMNLPKKLQDLKRNGNGWKPKKWGVSDNNYEWRVMVIHPSMSTICNYHVGTQHHHDVMDYFTIYSREKRLCELGI